MSQMHDVLTVSFFSTEEALQIRVQCGLPACALLVHLRLMP
jgi:hypothetical protein